MRASIKNALGFGVPLSLALLIALCDTATAQTKRVVVVYDERLDFPGLAALDASLVRTLRASASPPEIYREALDLSRFGSPGYLAEMRDHLRRKYRNLDIDVAIGVMGPSLDFLLENGATVFPGAAIVFCGIDGADLSRRELHGEATGVLVKREFRPTLELALRLHPLTRLAVVIGGTSEFETRLMEKVRTELKPLETRVNVAYMIGLTRPELLAAVASLPPHTVVLYTTFFRDRTGSTFLPHHVLHAIVQVANAPIYGFIDQYMGRGIVGGHLYSIDAHGELAARLTQRILAGERAGSIPLAQPASGSQEVDWRQIKKWNVNSKLLPADIRVRYREPSVWKQYLSYIMAVFVLSALQASIIVALIVERARRRQTQRRYALASANGRVGVWAWDLERDELFIDPFLETTLGYTTEESGHQFANWFRHVVPADAAAVESVKQDAIGGVTPNFEVEHRVRCRNGDIRWFLARGSVVYKNGKAVYMTGTETDITERKSAQEALEATRIELTRVSRLSMLGEFAASVAHEVRQPLTAITLNVQACLRWLKDPAPDLTELRLALDDVLDASRRADQVIQRNRELFRMRSVRREPLDINAVIRDIALLAAPRLDKSETRLSTTLAFDLPIAMGDRIELGQVLLNLISNSIDATEHLPPQQRRVRITTVESADGGVQVSVTDNGVGLEGVDIDRLFTLSYTTKADGTGVGLSLCRSIIVAHGGRIWATPNADAGATFWFTVPAVEAGLLVEA
jgi:PAS domain S-box-containing protein